MKTFPLCIFDGGGVSEEFLIYYPSVNLVKTTPASPLSGYIPLSGGNITGPLVYNAANLPSDDNEIINKEQVDSQILWDFYTQPLLVPVEGDVFIYGQIHLPYDTVTHDASVVPKQYVEGLILDFLPLSGGNLTGALELHASNTNKYTEPTHAIPKAYVDRKVEELYAVTQSWGTESLVAKTGDDTIGHVILSPAECDYPDENNQLISWKWAKEFIDCVFSSIPRTGEIVISQGIDDPLAKAITDTMTIILKLNFGIFRQWTGGGTCAGTEYPFSVTVEYTDVVGEQEYTHNFFYNPWGTLTPPHTRINQGWASFELELSKLRPRPQSIERVTLRAAGFEFQTYIDDVTMTLCESIAPEPGEVILKQTITDELSKDMKCEDSNSNNTSRVHLSFDLNVVTQERERDRPFVIILHFESEDGPGTWIRNFYHKEGKTKNIGDNYMIELDDWEHYDFDLSEICPCMTKIHELMVRGGGYGFDVFVDNVKLELKKKELVKKDDEEADKPKVEMEKRVAQPNSFPAGTPVVASADVRILSQDDDDDTIPFSMEIDYESEKGNRKHVHNVSSKPFPSSYFNKKKKKEVRYDIGNKCKGALYYSHPDCPGYVSFSGTSSGSSFFDVFGKSVGAFYHGRNIYHREYEFGSYNDDMHPVDINQELGTFGVESMSFFGGASSGMSSLFSMGATSGGFSSLMGSGLSSGTGISSLGGFGFGNVSGGFGGLGSMNTGTGLLGSSATLPSPFGATAPVTRQSVPLAQLPISRPPTISEEVVTPNRWSTVETPLHELPEPPTKVNSVKVKAKGNGTKMQVDNVETNVCSDKSDSRKEEEAKHDASPDTSSDWGKICGAPEANLLTPGDIDAYKVHTRHNWEIKNLPLGDNYRTNHFILLDYGSPHCTPWINTETYEDEIETYVKGNYTRIQEGKNVPSGEFHIFDVSKDGNQCLKDYIQYAKDSKYPPKLAEYHHVPDVNVAMSQIQPLIKRLQTEGEMWEKNHRENSWEHFSGHARVNFNFCNDSIAKGKYRTQVAGMIHHLAHHFGNMPKPDDRMNNVSPVLASAFPYCWAVKSHDDTSSYFSVNHTLHTFNIQYGIKQRDGSFNSAITYSGYLGDNAPVSYYEAAFDKWGGCEFNYIHNYKTHAEPFPSKWSVENNTCWDKTEPPPEEPKKQKGDYKECNDVLNCPPGGGTGYGTGAEDYTPTPGGAPAPGDPAPTPPPTPAPTPPPTAPTAPAPPPGPEPAIVKVNSCGTFESGDPFLTACDVDVTGEEGIDNATVKLDCGEGELTAPNATKIKSTWDDPSKTLTLSGAASVSDYKTALNQVKFKPDAGQTGQCDVTYTLDNGSTDTGTLDVTAPKVGDGSAAGRAQNVANNLGTQYAGVSGGTHGVAFLQTFVEDGPNIEDPHGPYASHKQALQEAIKKFEDEATKIDYYNDGSTNDIPYMNDQIRYLHEPWREYDYSTNRVDIISAQGSPISVANWRDALRQIWLDYSDSSGWYDGWGYSGAGYSYAVIKTLALYVHDPVDPQVLTMINNMKANRDLSGTNPVFTALSYGPTQATIDPTQATIDAEHAKTFKVVVFSSSGDSSHAPLASDPSLYTQV